MYNSSTKKKLGGRTYAGVDGYCPFAVYLGSPRHLTSIQVQKKSTVMNRFQIASDKAQRG
jgi:hypothetical protein